MIYGLFLISLKVQPTKANEFTKHVFRCNLRSNVGLVAFNDYHKIIVTVNL